MTIKYTTVRLQRKEALLGYIVPNYHGIAPSTVEYLYESIWGKPKDKTVGYFL